MGTLTGKVIQVIEEEKIAIVEVKDEHNIYDAFPMSLKGTNHSLEIGDIVETAQLRTNHNGLIHVEFVGLTLKYVAPNWLYKEGETVKGKLHTGELHEEEFIIESYEYHKEEEFDFFCSLRSLETDTFYDAIAPKEKGKPFELVTYEVVS